MSATSTSLTVDGVTLTVVVERKQVKNVNARLKGSTLAISAPLSMAESVLNEAILALARKLVRRMHARQVNSVDNPVELARRVAARFPVIPDVQHVLFVTTQATSWGSYSASTRTIRLHAALRSMPRWVLEAVIAHELAHITHLNHSPDFWALVRQVCPNTDRARGFLDAASWFGQRWSQLDPVERAMLTGISPCDQGDSSL